MWERDECLGGADEGHLQEVRTHGFDRLNWFNVVIQYLSVCLEHRKDSF